VCVCLLDLSSSTRKKMQNQVWIKGHHFFCFAQIDKAYAIVVKDMCKEESLFTVRNLVVLNYEASIATFIN
jgi:hypothetical protein